MKLLVQGTNLFQTFLYVCSEFIMKKRIFVSFLYLGKIRIVVS